VRRPDHVRGVAPRRSAVKATIAGESRADRKPRPARFPFNDAEFEANMAPQIVKTPTEARAAIKPGVTRYILVISTALVVILFVVAYIVAT
jgi:hypothetical protein